MIWPSIGHFILIFYSCSSIFFDLSYILFLNREASYFACCEVPTQSVNIPCYFLAMSHSSQFWIIQLTVITSKKGGSAEESEWSWCDVSKCNEFKRVNSGNWTKHKILNCKCTPSNHHKRFTTESQNLYYTASSARIRNIEMASGISFNKQYTQSTRFYPLMFFIL